MGLAGILLALGLLVWLSYRGWSILLLAPAAALIAAAAAGEPLLAHWTQTFMGGGAQFLAQFFPLFLLGALFGKLMEDSGSVEAIARFMTRETRHRSRLAGCRFGRGDRHLWRRQSFRCNFCDRADGTGPIQDRRHTTTPDARGSRPRHHDLHDVRVAWHPRPAKCHPDAILRHNALRCPGSRHHRGCYHACFRSVVARTGRECSSTRG